MNISFLSYTKKCGGVFLEESLWSVLILINLTGQFQCNLEALLSLKELIKRKKLKNLISKSNFGSTKSLKNWLIIRKGKSLRNSNKVNFLNRSILKEVPLKKQFHVRRGLSRQKSFLLFFHKKMEKLVYIFTFILYWKEIFLLILVFFSFYHIRY